MVDWKPPSDNKWIGLPAINLINGWLNLSYLDLASQIERMLAMGPASQALDDRFDLLERWIRRRLRTWNGGDLREFIIIHPEMMTGKWRTDHYLQDIFHVICNDPAIQTYIMELVAYPPVEQIMRLGQMIDRHPSMRRLHYRRRAWGQVATLIYRMGLDKILVCSDE